MAQPSLPLYFDNHATTPVDPRVLEAMLPFFKEHFGNAESSQHPYGWKAKAAVDHARGLIASLMNAEGSEILFTSGATESIHLAILGYLENQGPGRHIITAAAEHKATLEVCARAKTLGGHSVTVLPVNRYGQVTPDQIEKALTPETAIVSIMHGNNEIGSLNPISEIGALLRSKGIAFHVDAAQTLGKHPIDVRAMNIDLLSVSAHKLYGPKGAGCLFVSKSPTRIHLSPYMVGGGQERGLRGGTHNVPGIVGLGKACEVAKAEMAEESMRLSALRDRIIESVLKSIDDVELNGHPTERMCNNVNLTIRKVAGDALLLGLNDIAYSGASACSSGTVSHVLKAIGQNVDDPFATTVRFGLGRFTTEEQVDTLIRRLTETVRNARAVSTT